MRRILILLAPLALIALMIATAGPPAPLPPPGGFAFAAMGDAPYYPWEELRFRNTLADLDQHQLENVIEVGDVFWRPCTDAHYRKAFTRLDRLRAPVVYTPGDNEWTDCWREDSGGFEPLERLAALRRIFYAQPIALPQFERQPVYVENARWQQHGFVFATVHVPGSRNGTGRSPRDDAAARDRLAASIVWMRETFARAAGARGVILAFHADVWFEKPQGHDWRQPYEPFIAALEEESARYRKPVLIIHGDDHHFLVDHPIASVQNLTRLEVPGSPDVGWVRVEVTPRGASPFTFSKRVVPEWKLW